MHPGRNRCGAVRGVLLDPFMGAGTVAVAAIRNGRNYVGIELNPEYCKLAEKRIEEVKNEQETEKETV